MKNKTLREEMIASINEQLIDIYGFEFSPLSCTREQAAQFTSIVDSTLEDIMEANNWEETEETDILSDLSEEYDFNWESWAAFEAQREQTEEQTITPVFESYKFREFLSKNDTATVRINGTLIHDLEKITAMGLYRIPAVGSYECGDAAENYRPLSD